MLINCHSYHSLRYGTLSVEQLVIKAKKQGHDCIALTDINCMTGVYDFVLAAHQHGIKPVVGIEFRNGDELQHLVLAKNLKGFREINEYLSLYNSWHKDFPSTAPEFDHCYVIYPLQKATLGFIATLKDYEYIGVRIQELNSLKFNTNPKLIQRCVMLHSASIDSRFDYELNRVLRAIDHNVLLSKLKQHQHAQLQDHIPPIDALLEKYSHFPIMAENTYFLLDECSFHFDFKSNKNKQCFTESKYSDKELLRRIAKEGLHRRYGSNKEARERLHKELEVIHKLGFSAYFLITWDIIQHSLAEGFYHVGRGSGANSIVAYCIGITDVDPIELNLYFERFLNPHRLSPPDFDIDWSHRTRDHILDYIFDKYGVRHASFVGTIGTFRYRSPIRELGKVFGLPKEEIDKLTRSRPEDHPQDSLIAKIHSYCAALEGRPNLRSMHSCGILITEEPVYQYTATNLPPKGYPTAQIDMYISEDIGLEKLDVLSQRGLSSIDTTLQVIKSNRNETVDIHRVEQFKNDPLLNEKLSKGQTIGCFYIESPAMRGLLRRLKCDNYFTLVAASSIIRPGVAKSGMMREYILRHNAHENIQYLHPVFEKHLGETYGIMVYQEDVIKIAHHFAGLDLGAADILRRAMSGKTRSKQEFDNIKRQYFENCQAKGYSSTLSEEVYRQIESFAGYSFCKAHSASYSVESYQSLYLKTHYPLEFIVGVINNFGGFYRTEVYVHEAKMSGGKVLLPCVNKGDYLTSIDGDNIYLGFIHIERLEQSFKKGISKEREQYGPFKNLEDFIRRTQIAYEQLKQLIYVGALRFTGLSKAELIVAARVILSDKKAVKHQLLFDTPSKSYALPHIERSKLEDAYDEIDVLGFPVSLSTFELLNHDLPNPVLVDELKDLHEQKILMIGMLISIKDVPTARGHMNFGTWIDQEGKYFDSTHFPDVLKRFPFLGAGCYALYGKVVVDYHFPSIEVIKMKKLPLLEDPRYADNVHKSILPKTQELKGGKLPRAPYPSKNEVNKLYGRKD